MYKISTPMRYSSSAGDSGSFDKRTGTNKVISINSDSITVTPVFEGVGFFTFNLVIKVKLLSLKGSKFTIPDTYYQYSKQLTVSGFAANVDFLMQIRLIEVKSIADKNLALSGGKPKIQRTGTINQFRFKYATAVDPSPLKTVESDTTPTVDLLNLPQNYIRVIRPSGGVI